MENEKGIKQPLRIEWLLENAYDYNKAPVKVIPPITVAEPPPTIWAVIEYVTLPVPGVKST